MYVRMGIFKKENYIFFKIKEKRKHCYISEMSALRINKEGYFIFLLLLNYNNESLNYTSYKLCHFINKFNSNHSKTNL